jgi:hypothetical protein
MVCSEAITLGWSLGATWTIQRGFKQAVDPSV